MNILQFSFWCAAKWMDKRYRCFPIMVIWNIIQWWRIQWSFYLWRSCRSTEGIDKLIKKRAYPLQEILFHLSRSQHFSYFQFCCYESMMPTSCFVLPFCLLFHCFVLLLTSSLWKTMFYSSTWWQTSISSYPCRWRYHHIFSYIVV